MNLLKWKKSGSNYLSDSIIGRKNERYYEISQFNSKFVLFKLTEKEGDYYKLMAVPRSYKIGSFSSLEKAKEAAQTYENKKK
jgi:hypothetical protein